MSDFEIGDLVRFKLGKPGIYLRIVPVGSATGEIESDIFLLTGIEPHDTIHRKELFYVFANPITLEFLFRLRVTSSVCKELERV